MEEVEGRGAEEKDEAEKRQSLKKEEVNPPNGTQSQSPQTWTWHFGAGGGC